MACATDSTHRTVAPAISRRRADELAGVVVVLDDQHASTGQAPERADRPAEYGRSRTLRRWSVGSLPRMRTSGRTACMAGSWRKAGQGRSPFAACPASARRGGSPEQTTVRVRGDFSRDCRVTTRRRQRRDSAVTGTRGSSIVKMHPRPAMLRAVISPPFAATPWRAMASPRPRPLRSLLRCSKSANRSSGLPAQATAFVLDRDEDAIVVWRASSRRHGPRGA